MCVYHEAQLHSQPAYTQNSDLCRKAKVSGRTVRESSTPFKLRSGTNALELATNSAADTPFVTLFPAAGNVIVML